MPEVIEALVEGGKASAGPPLGPALGPMGVNIMQVVNAINEKTRQFEGMKVPVKVIVDPKTKKFDVEVGTPPATSLILNELKAEKGSGAPSTHKIGNLSIDQVIKIAKMKYDSLLGRTLKQKTKEILGTCGSMGVTVEGKKPKEIQKAIDAGEYDSKFV
ncbi:50S ribosomal protein L11 [Euryarchaeota archaeon ex4484_162]|nr:MAG: 50S ribosomal protein L11 [Euryarchaeota archaeon ex4484_162]RLF29632.1 MAG: 50S ribosomal protein L11 [Thermoplasmata archaeon]RLF35816.1 MAG: 50S ribosomal protein L11 [Thermoplasmata archaeon]